MIQALLLLVLLLQSIPPRIAALGPPESCEAGAHCAVWVVVFSDEAVEMSTTVPFVVKPVSVTDETPAGMQGMRWWRYTYLAPPGVYFLDYQACDAGGCASSRAFLRVGHQTYMPVAQKFQPSPSAIAGCDGLGGDDPFSFFVSDLEGTIGVD